MIPGTTTKISEAVVASAATITVKTDQVLLSGSTSVATIRANFGGGFSGLLIIVPTDGAVATLTTGNIALAVTMPQNRPCFFTYSKKNNIWYPGMIS